MEPSAEESVSPVTREENESISKRLALVLRHRLTTFQSHNKRVYKGGWIDLAHVLSYRKIFGSFSTEQVEYVIKNSMSTRDGGPRFQTTVVEPSTFVRATYGHSIDVDGFRTPLPLAADSSSTRPSESLLDMCLNTVADNIEVYAELGDAFDDALLRNLLQMLKERNKLSRRHFEVILGSGMVSLNLENCHVSSGILNMVIRKCPSLRALNLADCWENVIDQMVARMTKRLKNLRVLNLARCRHITDKGVRSIARNLKGSLEMVDLSGMDKITHDAVNHLLSNCANLTLLCVNGCAKLTRQRVKELRSVHPGVEIESDVLSDDAVMYKHPEDTPYGVFSNHAVLPMVVDGLLYPTVQHYYQSRKYPDSDYAEEIRTCETPMMAFKLGRRSEGFRTDWETVKCDVMKNGLLCKFRQHEAARTLLLGTEDRELVQHWGNKYWADGMDGSGENRHGRMLMEVRDELSSNKFI